VSVDLIFKEIDIKNIVLICLYRYPVDIPEELKLIY